MPGSASLVKNSSCSYRAVRTVASKASLEAWMRSAMAFAATFALCPLPFHLVVNSRLPAIVRGSASISWALSGSWLLVQFARSSART